MLRAQGRIAPALETCRNGITSRRKNTFGDGDTLTLEAGHQLARALIGSGDYTRARTLVDSLLERAPGNDNALRQRLFFDSAYLATKQDEHKRALADSAQGLALARAIGDDDTLSEALSESGNVQLSSGDINGAVTTYEELLELTQREFGPQHVQVAAAHADLSRAYRRQGRLDDAEREIRVALATDAMVLPKDDWRHANHLNSLTMILLARRDFPGALESADESLRINRIAHGSDHPEVANDLNNVGMLYALLENYSAAVAPLREALDLSQAKFGADHYETAITRANYGTALARAGDTRGGEAQILQALQSMKKAAEPDYDQQAAVYEKLVRLRIDGGDAASAMPLIDQIDASLAQIKPDAYWVGRTSALRAAALVAAGRFAEAKPPLDGAQKAISSARDSDPLLRVEVALLRADVAAHLTDDTAQNLALAARADLAALRNPPHRLVQLAQALPESAQR